MVVYWIALPALGLASGLLSGLFGVGGGIVIVPALVSLFGFDIKQAVGTSLAVILPTAVMGSITHFRHGNVRPAEACMVAVGAVISAVVGAELVQRIPGASLKRLFAVLLIVVAVRMLLEHPRPKASEPAGGQRNSISESKPS
ncbi:MAG: sulfite exporter TauE/SafE family protein [Armatimonadota bacterium]